MHCTEFQILISQFIDDALPDTEHEEALHHLKECVACRSEVELMRQIESVTAHNLYDSPGEEYWRQMPVLITNRLKKKQSRSLISTGLTGLQQTVLSPRWRVAATFASRSCGLTAGSRLHCTSTSSLSPAAPSARR